MPSQRSLRTLLTLTIAVCGSLTVEKAFAAEPAVNLGSTSFFEGIPGFIHYISSKGGVIGFTRGLGKELGEFGIRVLSHVTAVGPVKLERAAEWDELVALSQRDDVLLGCVDPAAEARMKEAVDEAYRTGDTVGAVFEVVARGVPVGLGSHIAWDTRLDGKLAQAIMSIQAVKGVFIGNADEAASYFGSKVQDTIGYSRERREFTRGSNKAGGIEGGISNGQEIVVRGLIKPISTLRKPLESVDMQTKEAALGAYERSDVCVLPAAGVIGEAMVALVLAQCFLDKFGGDSLRESRRNFDGYIQQVKEF